MKLRFSNKRYFGSMKEFSLLREIGIGTFGSVQVALHIETSKCYAVKIIELSNQLTEQELLVLQREIYLHSTIDHPHIIKLWDTIEEDNKIHMIMEYAENGTLFSYQNSHTKISELEAFRFFSQTLNAVRHLHSLDIMHRDLKPENILLDNCFNVKICDLGWATDNIQAKRKTFCGTYQYMAPEMVFEKEYNYSIDIWALGVLLFELLHGAAPFPAKSLENMKQRIKKGSYQLASHLSRDLKSLIVDVLQFDPSRRPSLKSMSSHPWVQRMKREVLSELKVLQANQVAETQMHLQERDRPILAANKKHKRLDSLVYQSNPAKTKPAQETLVSTGVTSTMQSASGESQLSGKKKARKKCKTQGEQSLQKIFTELSRGGEKVKVKKEKENVTLPRQGEVQAGRPMQILKDNSALNSNSKVKKLHQKISQLSGKYFDRKKSRVKGKFIQ